METCKYCNKDKIIMKESVINLSPFYMCGDDRINATIKEIEKIGAYELALFIDRGFLRLVEIEDSGCLDHGEKIKIISLFIKPLFKI